LWRRRAPMWKHVIVFLDVKLDQPPDRGDACVRPPFERPSEIFADNRM
jgi:hypothetical protein